MIRLLKNKFFAAFLLSLLSLACLFTLYAFKWLSLLLVPFSLTPLFYAAYRFGPRTLLLANAPLIAVTGYFFRALLFNYLINLFLPALLLALVLKDFRPAAANRTYYAFLLYALLLTIALVLMLRSPQARSFYQEGIHSLNNSFDRYIGNLKARTPSLKPAEIMQMEVSRKQILTLLTRYYPLLIFYLTSLFYLANFVFSSFLLSRFHLKKPLYLNLLYIKNPEHYIWLFLAGWLAVMIAVYTKQAKAVTVLLNAALLLSFPYIFTGGLILIYRTLMLKFSVLIKVVLLFLFLQLILYSMKYSLIALGAIGLVDFWFDFRKPAATDGPGAGASTK